MDWYLTSRPLSIHLLSREGFPLPSARGLDPEASKKENSPTGTTQTRELLLHIAPVVVPPKDLTLDLDKQGRALHSTDLLVGNATIPAKAAAAMAGAMRPQGGGHGKFPLVRAMGSVAAHRAMISGMLAQRYLDNDERGIRFCIVPYWSREMASEQNSKQLVFRLIHLPKKNTPAK